jgi:dolichyl-phosphate-mannose--protein O-mannosyl transferase
MDNTFLSSMYFDEIYYARTAYEYFHKMEPFTWVHPPLGMLLIGLGILIFGMNPVGWRIIPDISGVILLIVMYVFAKKVFKSRIAAIFSSLLLALDFMHFSLSRMASIDPFSTLFITLEVLFLFNYVSYKRNNEHNKAIISLTYCGIFFGLAAASKWSGFFTVPLLTLCSVFYEIKYSNRSLISISKSIILCLITLVYIPLSIYALCYFPYFTYTTNNNFFNLIYNLQGYMINYHTNGTKFATHPYSSNWWGWPILSKPLSVFYYQNGSEASSVVFMGNPAIWWMGIITSVITLFHSIRLKQHVACFISLAIASLYLPWMLSERISFIYYFYSVIPFWILSITYVFNYYQFKSKYYLIYLGLTLLLFIAFYPALSGILFSRSYVAQYLLWFKSWLF